MQSPPRPYIEAGGGTYDHHLPSPSVSFVPTASARLPGIASLFGATTLYPLSEPYSANLSAAPQL